MAPLGIAVIVARGRAPGPGARRLLADIAGDPRYRLACLAEAPAPAPGVPTMLSRALALESRLLPAPDSAPPLVGPFVPLRAVAAAGPLDVIVDFSMGPEALALAGHARHGLWRLSCFAPGAGFAEARAAAPVSEVVLTRHTAQGAETIGRAAYPVKFLASRNAAFLREKSVQLAGQALARLAAGGLRGDPPVEMPRQPGAGALPGYAWRVAGELGARALRRLAMRAGRRPGMFQLRVGEGDALSFDPARGVDLVPPRGVYWADPFLLRQDGGLFVFFEEYDYATRRGRIAAGRLDGAGMIRLGTALEQPHHLSYPFVFRHGDDILMIPETQAARRIEVWRAVEFPLRWERVATALEGVAAADTTVFCHQGRWWMLTNICRDSFGDFCSELHLFALDSPLLNRVDPHPLNPVVIDARSARGGGRVFCRDGRLYRPSQDNSHAIYGWGLNLMEITRISPTEYGERRVRHVTPDFAPGFMGCHHLDAADGRFVIDVRRRHFGA